MRFLLSLHRLFGDFSMLDILFIAAGCAMVAVAIAYTYACDRL
jgi:hypothetical protein